MGATVSGLASVTDDQMLPKLFRRLASCFAADGRTVDFAGFKPWLAAADERVFDPTRGQESGFDDLAEIEGGTVRLPMPATGLSPSRSDGDAAAGPTAATLHARTCSATLRPHH